MSQPSQWDSPLPVEVVGDQVKVAGHLITAQGAANLAGELAIALYVIRSRAATPAPAPGEVVRPES